MRFFSRIGDMLDANIALLLERAKNPSHAVRKMANELEDTLAQIKLAASEVLAQRTQLMARLERFRNFEKEWHHKAMLALGKDREDLAREALEQKLTHGRKAAALSDQLDSLGQQIEQYNADIAKLEEKLVITHTRKRELKTLLNQAKTTDPGGKSKSSRKGRSKKMKGSLSDGESPWIQLDRVTQLNKELQEIAEPEGKISPHP